MPKTIDLGPPQKANSCRINSVEAGIRFTDPQFCVDVGGGGVLGAKGKALDEIQKIIQSCDATYQAASTPPKIGIHAGSATLDVANALLGQRAMAHRQPMFFVLTPSSNRAEALDALDQGKAIQVNTTPPHSHSVLFGFTNGFYWKFDANGNFPGNSHNKRATITIFVNKVEMELAFPQATEAEFAEVEQIDIWLNPDPRKLSAGIVVNEYYANKITKKLPVIHVMPQMDATKKARVLNRSFHTSDKSTVEDQKVIGTDDHSSNWSNQAQWRMITSPCILYGTPTGGLFNDADRVPVVITSGTAPADTKDVYDIALAWLWEQDKAGASTVVFPTLGSAEKDAAVTKAIDAFIKEKRTSVTKVIHLTSPAGIFTYDFQLSGSKGLTIAENSSAVEVDVLQFVANHHTASNRVGLINAGSSHVIGGDCNIVVTRDAVQLTNAPKPGAATLEAQIADCTDLLFQQSEELNEEYIKQARAAALTPKVGPPKPPKSASGKEDEATKKKRHLATINLGALTYVKGMEPAQQQQFINEVFTSGKPKTIVAVKDVEGTTLHYYKVPDPKGSKPDIAEIDTWLGDQINNEKKMIPTERQASLQHDLLAKTRSKLAKVAMEMDPDDLNQLDIGLQEAVGGLHLAANAAIMTLKPDYGPDKMQMIKVKQVEGKGNVFKDYADMASQVNAMGYKITLYGEAFTVTAKVQGDQVIFYKKGAHREEVITDADLTDYAAKHRKAGEASLGKVIMDALAKHVTKGDTFVYAQVQETQAYQERFAPKL